MRKEALQSFLKQYDYPADAIVQLCAAQGSIETNSSVESVFCTWRKLYDAAPDIDYAAANAAVEQACAACGINAYTGLFLFYCSLVPRLQQRYCAAGYTQAMLHDTVLDLRHKAVECHSVYGVWGTFVAHWYEGFFALQRFTLGRLQFEVFPLQENCVVNGVAYAKGTQVLNVHIPSAGTLAPALCDAAFAQARAFFAREYPLFVCESWLLFPPNKMILEEQKNILAFARRFQLIKTFENPVETDMWRIFGCMPQPPYADLPETTSLQRAYKKWLQEGNAPGEGLGVFLR